MKVTAINVVFAYVEDIARSRRFYQDVLGLGKPVKEGKEWVEWKLGKGSNFALCRASAGRLEGSVPERGTIKFSFVVSGLADARQELRHRAITLHVDIREAEGFRYLEFPDPDGNILRLLEWTA